MSISPLSLTRQLQNVADARRDPLSSDVKAPRGPAESSGATAPAGPLINWPSHPAPTSSWLPDGWTLLPRVGPVRPRKRGHQVSYAGSTSDLPSGILKTWQCMCRSAQIRDYLSVQNADQSADQEEPETYWLLAPRIRNAACAHLREEENTMEVALSPDRENVVGQVA